MDEARAARLYREADAGRWNLPPAAFAGTVAFNGFGGTTTISEIQLDINTAVNRSIGVRPADVYFSFSPLNRLGLYACDLAPPTVPAASPQHHAITSRLAALAVFEQAVTNSDAAAIVATPSTIFFT